MILLPEHSIGVGYLARVFVEQIRSNQPELRITDVDVLCVEIAGICHDLGHGPHSHMFDGKVIPQLYRLEGKKSKFIHEHASIGIFDLLIEDNDLIQQFVASKLTKDDIHFIKELILGDEKMAPSGHQWKGRPGKEFLFDIVANKRNGIDVDKFDYFKRDCRMLGISASFDDKRLMKFARVFNVEKEDGTQQAEICFHCKEAWNIHELFHTRYALHKRAYQHRVHMAAELMLTGMPTSP